VIHLAREIAKAKIYPAVDLRTSRSRLIETGAVAEEHRVVAEQVRRVLAAALWNVGDPPEAAADRRMVERARKLQNYFTQPFFVAEPYTHRPGTHVGLEEALRTCRDILEGRHDEIPVKALFCRRHRGDPQSSRRGSIAGGGRNFHVNSEAVKEFLSRSASRFPGGSRGPSLGCTNVSSVGKSLQLFDGLMRAASGRMDPGFRRESEKWLMSPPGALSIL
jgi:hypothetical protein